MKNSTKQTIKIYFEQTKSFRLQLLIISISTIAASIIGVIIPTYYKKFFDSLTISNSREHLFPILINILLIVFVFEVVRWAAWRIATFVNNYTGPAIITKLAVHSFSELHKRSFTYFNNNFVGTLVKRVNWFVRSFDFILARIFWDLLPATISLITIIVVLTKRDPIFGLGVGIWLVLFLSINWFFVNYKIRYDLMRSEAESKQSGILADTVTNNQNVKLLTGYKREVELFKNAALKVQKIKTISWNTSSVFDGIQGLLAIILEMGIVYVGITFWMKNQLTLGDFILLQSYVGLIIDRTWGFGRLIRDIYEGLADAEEMTLLLNTPVEITDMPNAKELRVTEGKIDFSSVGFNYNETRQVIKNLNMSIPGKQKVAFVGSSGSGKTTIVKLLLRMHDLTSGSITIDGQKINEVTQESLWNSISLVPQDPILFHRSLMENIRYGKADATDEEVIGAAKLAHCHEFITSLAEGYDTFVGERGIKLSGGERQRVAIARAILRNAPILILDEATSSLDSESEALIQDALNSLMKDKTVIVIAHRLSTIMRMDRIIVVSGGSIIEDGTHNELLSNPNGHYSQLWKIQAGGFISDSGEELLMQTMTEEQT